MSVSDRHAKRLFFCIPVLVLLLALTACESKPPAPPDTRAADEAAIRTAEAAMIKTFAALDAAGAVGFYTEDVVGMSADSPAIHGRENMRQYFETLFKEKPEFAASTAKVEVARSGDLAYSMGTGTMTVKPKKGKPVQSGVKYVSVWKKQPDGTWKIIVDTLIPDPAPKAAAKHTEHKGHKKSHKK